VQAVDHQSEGLDTISDFNLFSSMHLGVRSTQSDESLKRTNSDGQHFRLAGHFIVEVLLPEQVPHVRKQLNGFIGQFGVNLMLAE
jgi:hypothetical protein